MIEPKTPLPWEMEFQQDYRDSDTSFKRAILRSDNPESGRHEQLMFKPWKRVLEHTSWYVFPDPADIEYLLEAVNNYQALKAEVEGWREKIFGVAAIGETLYGRE